MRSVRWKNRKSNDNVLRWIEKKKKTELDKIKKNVCCKKL